MDFRIENLTKNHWKEVSQIYKAGIDTGSATFEQQLPEWRVWDKNHIEEARIIATYEGIVVGWAALSTVSSRCIYAGVAEVSVYVDSDYQGKGCGVILLNQLILESEEVGIWTLNASVFPENIGSIILHKKCGFREIGYKEKVGKMGYGVYKGQWRDNVLLELRSKNVGL